MSVEGLAPDVTATTPTRAGAGADGEPILTLRNLSKSFGGVPALRHVDLEVRAGEVHALMGQNGSGKSTLIKLLSGFHLPDAGSEVTLNGQAYALDGVGLPGIRFVHQDLGLIDVLDAVDNFAFGSGYVTGRSRRIKWRQQRARSKAAIEAVGYEVDLTRPVGTLPPIERTAIAIARALQGVEETSIMVLDEPTATMPRREVEHLLGIIRRLKARGLGVIYVSHHLDEVFEVADRVTVLRDGAKVASCRVKDVTVSAVVDMMTGGAVDTVSTDAKPQLGKVALTVSKLSSGNIRDLSFAVRAGEVLGVAGISGSGRGEICAAIFGAAARRGTVSVVDRTLRPLDPAQAVELGLGYVPANRQKSGLIMLFSVGENVTLPGLGKFASLTHLRLRADRRAARSAVVEFGVKTPSTSTPVAALSGGNQQKIVLGKWLRMKPAVLLLDEPSQGIDIAAKAEMHKLIDQAAASGAAVVVCSSDEDELQRLCDRALVIRAGVISAELVGTQITAHRLADESQASTRSDLPPPVGEAPADVS